MEKEVLNRIKNNLITLNSTASNEQKLIINDILIDLLSMVESNNPDTNLSSCDNRTKTSIVYTMNGKIYTNLNDLIRIIKSIALPLNPYFPASYDKAYISGVKNKLSFMKIGESIKIYLKDNSYYFAKKLKLEDVDRNAHKMYKKS